MKRTLLLFSCVLISSIVLAQAPEAFKYQAVVRDNSGNLISEQSVGFQIDILKGATDGTSVYTETHSRTTNTYGLVNLEIGSGTTTDDLGAIDWGEDDYFIQISLDATGGTSYELMGTSQLLSVPYALYSTVADSVIKESQTLEIDGDTLRISSGNSVTLPSGGENTPEGTSFVVFEGDISDSEAAQKIANEVGANTIHIRINNTTNLTTLNLTGAKYLVELKVSNNSSLSSIIFGDLEIGTQFDISDCPALTTLDFSKLETVSNLNINRCGLTSLQVPTLSVDNTFNVSLNSLTSESVNSLLAHLVSISPSITNVYIRLHGQNPSAPPTGQGIIDKATLIGNGNFVLTD